MFYAGINNFSMLQRLVESNSLQQSSFFDLQKKFAKVG